MAASDAPAHGGLDPSEDAYGAILMAVLEGRPALEIIERDDGLIWGGDPADYFAPFRRWPAVERRAMRWVRGRVLDVGTGAGRVSLHLQERGHEVVAIDESPLAVEVARRRGVRDARVCGLADAGEAMGVFDTVLLLRNNFGLADDGMRAAPLLERLAALTSARGRIVTDSVDPARADPVFRDGAPGAPAAPRIRVRWQHRATPWFRYLMLPPEGLERLVAGTGWRVVRVIDDGSPRFAVVLEKASPP
ncbi:MAG TPA: methyltransferase domain-containing protein [Miltoncostaeaceae bacterium]|nr:methyltransferase domain-containing protein [Miltoncostaeaceae bacterium]